MKKVILVILMAAILLVGIMPLTACVDKGDIWLNRVELKANLLENGDLTVSEIWEVEASSQDGYRNLYKVFDLYDTNFNKYSDLPLESISVYDITNSDTAIRYEYDKTISNIEYEGIPKNKNIVWYLDDSNGLRKVELGLIMPRMTYGVKKFSFNYTITNAAGMYDDSVMLYWQPYSTDFSLYIDNFSATVQLPQSRSTSGTYAWFHTVAESGFLEIKPDRYLYTAQEVEAGTMLETRILIPKDTSLAFEMFDDDMAKRISGEKVDEIISEEQRFAEEWAEEMARERRRSIIDGVMAAVAVILGIAATAFVRIYNRKLKGNYPKYIREVPSGWSAGELGHLFYYYDGGVTKNNRRGRLLAATILDLTRRYYINIIPEGDGDYKIDVLDSPELKLSELKTHEKALLDLLRSVEDYFGRPFDMDDFEKYAKKEYIKVDKAIKVFQNSSQTKFKISNFLDKLNAMFHYIPFIGAGVMGIGAMVFYQGTLPIFGVGLIGGGAILTIFRPKIPRLNAEGEAEYRRAHALKDYMRDFSNLKEYNIPKLVLWEEYLVYATMMGISKEVIKSLRLVYSELREIEARSNYSYFSTRGFIWTY
ncbi:MAG: DUF2207 domain-containing protein, partial [Clostridia bacterium]